MNTKQRIGIYNALDRAGKSELAQVFIDANRDDESFCKIAELHQQLVPAFKQAIQEIRDGK